MDTVSFISLMVDYKVPPLSVLEAVNEQKLRPIVKSASLSTATLENIFFERSEAETVFWRYSYEWRSAEERAELEKRFQSHTALVAAIIGAVVGTAASRLIAPPPSGAEGPAISASPGKVQEWHPDEDFQFQIDPMPGFQEPVNTNAQEFWLSFSSRDITYTLQGDGSFFMRASADGVRMPPWRNPHPELVGVMLGHGSDWFTVYEGEAGAVNPLPNVNQLVKLGEPVVEVRRRPGHQTKGYFSIWLHRPGGFLRPVHPAETNWPNLPTMP